MSYESLIDRLSEDLKPVRRRRLGIDLAIVAAICAIELALFFGMGAARPDMPMMMKQPTFWWRLQSLGLIALISGRWRSCLSARRTRRDAGFAGSRGSPCFALPSASA